LYNATDNQKVLDMPGIWVGRLDFTESVFFLFFSAGRLLEHWGKEKSSFCHSFYTVLLVSWRYSSTANRAQEDWLDKISYQ